MRPIVITRLAFSAVVFAAAAHATAAIETFLAPVAISPAAIAADPTLANYQTWDLRVDVPAGQNWGYTGTRATLAQGSFYNSAFGSDFPHPQLWALFPQLRYDTFITKAADPDDDSTFGAPDANPGKFPGTGEPRVFSDTVVSAVWLTPSGVLSGPGVFTVARLTFTLDAQGLMIGFTGDRPTTEHLTWSFPIPIPEPATCAALCAACVACAAAARSRRQYQPRGGQR
jgi:hypothetical protein